MRSWSGPSSYVSRTLPRAKSLSGRSVLTTAGPAITGGTPAGIAKSRGLHTQSKLLEGEVGVLKTCPWVEHLIEFSADPRHDIRVLFQDCAESGAITTFCRLHRCFLNHQIC